MKDRLVLSVVIPAYNEQHRIAATLEACIAYLRQQTYAAEIIVVDDGSRDATAEIARSFAAAWPHLQVLELGKN